VAAEPMTRIVVYAHRYKRPKKKKKPRAAEMALDLSIGGMTFYYHARRLADRWGSELSVSEHRKCNYATYRRLAWASVDNDTRAELRMAEQHAPNPEVEAFFARNVRPGGPMPPK
jgi:hypothetical protein